MAAHSPPPLGEVSCRVTGYTIQQLQRMGLPTAQLAQGTTHTLDDLQRQSDLIPWEDYLVFLRNSYDQLTANQLVELCSTYQGSPYLRPLLSTAGLWFHPGRYFQWVADSKNGVLQQLFRCVKTQFRQTSDREVLIEEVIDSGRELPPDIFWETQSIAFGALTNFFGLGPSFVTWEPIERGAAFRVRLPRRRPIRFALSWIASWFRPNTDEDIRSALSFVHERSIRLEREISDRKVAESGLLASEERFRRISDAVPGIVYQYHLEPDGRQGFDFVSGGATALTGYTPEELIARPEIVWERVLPDDISRLQESILESARTGTPWQIDFRFQAKNGEIRWVRGRSTPEPLTTTGRVVWNGLLTDVTSEKQSDERLRARDILLQKLSEQVPGFIYQYQQWPDGRSCFPYASEGIRDVYEVTPEDVRESAELIFGRLHPEDFDAVAESIRRSLESLEAWRCEYRVCLPKRGIRWMDGHAVPERLPDGSTIWHGYIRDVTDRKSTEDALRVRKDLYLMLARTNRAVSQSGSVDELYRELCLIAVTTGRFLFAWVGVPDGNRLKLAARAGNDNGYLDEIVISLDNADPRSRGPAAQVLASGCPVVTNDFLAASLTSQWHSSARRVGVAASAGFPLMQNGAVVAVFSVYASTRDFFTPELVETLGEITPSVSFALDGFARETARRVAQQAVRQSEERWKFALEGAEAGVLDWDIESDRILFSDRWRDITGYQPGTIAETGDGLQGLVHPDDLQGAILDLELTLEGRKSMHRIEHRLRCADGRWIWIESRSIVTSRGPEGNPLRVIGTHTDITERKQVEQALRESELRYRTLIETCSDAIFLLDLTGRIRSANPAAVRMHGYSMDELLSMRMQDLDLPEDAAAVPDRMKRLQAGESLTFEVVHRRKDGTTFPIEVITSAVEIGGEWLVLAFDRDITERKRDEDLLRFQNALLQAQTEASPDGILVVDPANRILSYNQRFLEVWGIPDELLATRDDTKVLARARSLALDPVGFGARVSAIYADPDISSYDEVALADGRTLDRYSNPIRDIDGKRLGRVWYFRDISERKRAVRALEEAERRQRLALDTAHMGTWELEIENNRVNWDTRQQELFGFGPGEYDGHPDTFFTRVHPDDIEMVRGRVAEAMSTGCDYEAEFRIYPRPGVLRWVSGHGRVIRNSKGRPVRMVGVNSDLTDRKEAILALQEAQRRQQLALDAGRMGTWDWEIGSERLVWDDRQQLLFGFEPGAFDYRLSTFLGRIHPEDLAAVHRALNAAADGNEFDGEFRICRPDGTVRWIHGTGTVIPRNDYAPPRLVGINYDVTARKAAEAALRESEERLRIFVENAPAGVAMLDRDLRYISYSRRWLTDFGLGEENLVGRSHFDVFPDATDRWKEIHRRCLTGVSERCEQDRFDHANGSVEYLRWEIQPWTDATGAIGGLVFFSELITDRVQAEDQIRASLREKEAMLKEIHHRVKNNLQVISSLLSLQAARVTHPSATDVLAESQNRVRAMALVHETLYRSDDLARVDLSRYLGELCGYLFRSYGVDSSRVRLEVAVEPVTVSLDKTIPCGLLVNEIVSNSLKHAFTGNRSGTVTVCVRTQPDGCLNMTLADDGIGLPVEVLVDRTPSLGLQLVNILTEQIGGQLTVERSPGTRFVITFAP